MSCLPKRRRSTARFFVSWQRISAEGRGARRAVVAAPRTILFALVSLLAVSCTLLPALPTADSATIPGEPAVQYAGEPQGVAEVATPPGTGIVEAPLSPLESTPVATVQDLPSAEFTQQADSALMTPATSEGVVAISDSALLATPTPALDMLLAQPVATTHAAAGGLAGAAGLVRTPAPTVGSPADASEAEEPVGDLPSPALAPALLPEGEVTTEPKGEAQPESLPDIEVTPDGVERALYVPILMYHYLSVPPADANIYRKDLSVAPDLFAQHLDRLLAEGYTTISLYDFAQALQTGRALPEKPVILTFDDGYRDNYENAFPALRDRGMTATFFVVTDFIDEERPEYMTWEMAREMLAGGMSIESHGRNHASLKGRDDDYLIWQALGSLETIAYELGVRPRFVAYPAGEYDANTMRIFESAGYWAGVTTIQGATHENDNPFELTRVRMRGTTTPGELIRLLKVDW